MENKGKKIAIIILSVFIGIGLQIACLATVCHFTVDIMANMASGLCGPAEIFQTIVSPDTQWKAIVYEYNCGATTPFSTNVSIFPIDQEFPTSYGNIMYLYGHPDWNTIVVSWEDDHHLMIVYEASVGVYRKEEEYKDIFIEYRKIPP